MLSQVAVVKTVSEVISSLVFIILCVFEVFLDIMVDELRRRAWSIFFSSKSDALLLEGTFFLACVYHALIIFESTDEIR